MQEDVERSRLAAKAAPNDPKAHYELGRALFAAGDDRGAMAAFDHSLTLDPNNPHAHFRRGLCLVQLRDDEGARAGFERAIALDGHWWHFWCELGTAYRRLGQPQQAEQALLRSIQCEAGHANVHDALASLLAARGLHEESAEQWRLALAADPNLTNAHYNLGVHFLHGPGNDPSRALQHFQAASNLAPDDFQAAGKLVQALFRLNQHQQADTLRQGIAARVREAHARGQLQRAEFCIDQFPLADGATVFVYENALTAQQQGALQIWYSFKVVRGQQIERVFQLESSDAARQLGGPAFLLGVRYPDGSHATLGPSWSHSPSYPELQQAVLWALSQPSPPLAVSIPQH